MNNWNTNLTIGDRVNVTLAQTTRDRQTHRIVVKHTTTAGMVNTINPNSSNVGVRFDDGRVHEVHGFQVQKLA